MIKAGEVAKRLKVHPNTIRNWADDYAAYMSPEALGQSPGGKRRFTDDDLRILATVAELRGQGVGADKIHEALTNGRRADIIPPLPTPEEESARASIALIPLPEYTRILDILKSREEELSRVLLERDTALADKDTLNTKIADLQREIGQLQGRLESVERVFDERRPAEYWVRLLIIAMIGMLVIVGLAVVFLANRGG